MSRQPEPRGEPDAAGPGHPRPAWSSPRSCCSSPALLGWREWRDRRARDPDLSPEDARHFALQDARRFLGIVVLVLLAVGPGRRLPAPAAVGNRTNPQFLGIWLGVFLLIFVLLALAMVDWSPSACSPGGTATRSSASGSRSSASEAPAEAQRDAGNGHGEGPLGDLFR